MSRNESMLDGSRASGTRGRRLPANRRGAILALVAVMMVAFIGLLVLTIDGGSLQRQKRTAQTAADAGAKAGAIEKYRKQLDPVVRVSALSETSRNLYTNGQEAVTVDVNLPPLFGNFAGVMNYVEVVVTKRMPTFFGGFFGFDSVTVRARAVGGIASDKSCVYVLNPTASQSLNIGAGGSLNAPGCGIVVNSTASDALSLNNNADITGASIAVSGGLDVGRGVVSPTPSTGVVRSPDPLKNLYDFSTVPNTCLYDLPQVAIKTSQTLSPGTWCRDIDVQNGIVTLNPGLYIMRGATLKVKASATLMGNGVTFLMTDLAGTYGNVQIESNSIVQLTAWAGSPCTYDATSCPLSGILFYQGPLAPPTVSCNGAQVGCNYFNSSSGSFLNGSLYFPTQTVAFKSGTTSAVFDGTLIAAQVIVTAGTIVTFTTQAVDPYSPLKRATIVE